MLLSRSSILFPFNPFAKEWSLTLSRLPLTTSRMRRRPPELLACEAMTTWLMPCSSAKRLAAGRCRGCKAVRRRLPSGPSVLVLVFLWLALWLAPDFAHAQDTMTRWHHRPSEATDARQTNNADGQTRRPKANGESDATKACSHRPSCWCST